MTPIIEQILIRYNKQDIKYFYETKEVNKVYLKLLNLIYNQKYKKNNSHENYEDLESWYWNQYLDSTV